MFANRIRHVLAAPVVAALAASALVFLTPGVAHADDVSTEAEFTTAWEANGTTLITLTTDITLTCDSGSPFRNSATNIVVEGNGHTLTQTCPNDQVMSSHGTGSVTLLDITVTGGHATGLADEGGALLANGDLTVRNSTITGNQSDSTGGGIVANGTITVVDSTITNNSTGGNGGGIAGNNVDSAVVVINSTVTGNTVTEPDIGGGGIAASDLTLIYSTVVGNTATRGSNVFIHQSTFLFRNSFGSVVANPLGGGTNCDFQGEPAVTSSGYNYSDDDSCLFTQSTDVQNGADPQLQPLADNGGPTQTMAVAPTSPLVSIPSAACQDDGASGITTDQRGEPRPGSSVEACAPEIDHCTIGAFEDQSHTIADCVAPPVPAPPIAAPPRFTG